MVELQLLMKNEINPAFSKITFLVFHGEEMEQDPAALQAELSRYGEALRKALSRLRVWQHPPTESTEGKQVFYAYALSVDKSAARLVDALGRADNQDAAKQLEGIAKTCNSCHHFFRLNIEDSVVGPSVVSDLAFPPEEVMTAVALLP